MTRNESVLWLAAGVMLAIFLSSGCGAAYYSAKTTANYKVLPDGTLEANYDSSKEQQGLVLEVNEEAGKKTVSIHVDKSGTNESAIAAALAANLKLIALVETLAAAAGKVPK